MYKIPNRCIASRGGASGAAKIKYLLTGHVRPVLRKVISAGKGSRWPKTAVSSSVGSNSLTLRPQTAVFTNSSSFNLCHFIYLVIVSKSPEEALANSTKMMTPMRYVVLVLGLIVSLCYLSNR